MKPRAVGRTNTRSRHRFTWIGNVRETARTGGSSCVEDPYVHNIYNIAISSLQFLITHAKSACLAGLVKTRSTLLSRLGQNLIANLRNFTALFIAGIAAQAPNKATTYRIENQCADVTVAETRFVLALTSRIDGPRIRTIDGDMPVKQSVSFSYVEDSTSALETRKLVAPIGIALERKKDKYVRTRSGTRKTGKRLFSGFKVKSESDYYPLSHQGSGGMSKTALRGAGNAENGGKWLGKVQKETKEGAESHVKSVGVGRHRLPWSSPIVMNV